MYADWNLGSKMEIPVVEVSTKKITFLALFAAAAFAQTAPVTILEIDVENVVNYVDDVADPAKVATAPGISPSTISRIFKWAVAVGDIAAINGRPVKGLYTYRFGPGIMATTTLTPGRNIADMASGCPSEAQFAILYPDGTPIGSITASGFNAGTPPPGAPATATSMTLAVVGGTGPFMGVRGQLSRASDVGTWTASMLEDPACRRVNKGGTRGEIVQLIPMARPEVVVTSAGPAVLHADDFSPVTNGRPAQIGEHSIMSVTGLGPTKPVVEAGKPFSAFKEGSLHLVTSPVEVAVNGQAAEVVNSVGWPGMTGVYRVDFRVPQGTAAGQASLQVTAAWIPGSEVKIPVR